MDASDQRLDDYLDEWFALLRTQVQPTTWHGDQNSARAYLRPGLGQVRVGELTVRMLNLHYPRLLESGGRRGVPGWNSRGSGSSTSATSMPRSCSTKACRSRSSANGWATRRAR
jgi:hypothetical protein